MRVHMFFHLYICVVSSGGVVGLAFLQEECLLNVFTADSYFIRRVGC